MDDVFKVPKTPVRRPRQIRPLTENGQNLPKRKMEPELKAQPVQKMPTRPPSQRPKRFPKTYQYFETSLFPKLENSETDIPEPGPPAIKSELPATKTTTLTIRPKLTTVAKTVPISAIKPGTSLLITKTGHSIPRLITRPSASSLKAVPSTSLLKAGPSTSLLKAGTSTTLLRTGSTSLLKTGSISSSTVSSGSSKSLLKPGTSLLKSRLTRASPSTSLLKPGTSLLKSGTSTSLLKVGTSTSLLKTGSSPSLLKVGSSTLAMNAGSSSVGTGSTTTFINLGPSSSTIYAEPSTAFIDLGPAMFPINAGASTSSLTVDPPPLAYITGSATSDIQAVPSTSTMNDGFASLPKDSALAILATEAANLATAAEAKRAAEAKKAAAEAKKATTGKKTTRGRPPGSGKGKGKAGPSTIKKGTEKSGLPASAGVAGPPPLALRSIDSAKKGKPPSSIGKAGPTSAIKRTAKNSEALIISDFLTKIRTPEPASKRGLNPDINVVRQTTIDLLKELMEKTDELEEIKEQHSILKNKHKHLEWDFYKLTGTNIDLSTYNTNLNLVNTQLTEQLDSLASELRAYEIDHKKLEVKENELTKLKNIEQEYTELKVGYDLVTSSCNELTKEVQRLTTDCKELREKTRALQQEVIEGHLLRRSMHNTIQELRGNIQVYCRIRAPISGEHERPRFCIGYPNHNSLEVQKTIEGKPVDSKMVFIFDKVFRPVTTQAQCFEELVQFVQSALDGYDVCVFAYGQTGSGKTYTLRGYDDVDHIGFMNRAVTFMFKTIEHLRKFNWIYEVKASFIEIYNECIRDLLNPNTVDDLPHEIKVNNGTSLTVTNLKVLPIESFDAFARLLKEAEKNRATSAPDFSEHCTKSHAVYKVSLIGTNGECNGTYAGSLTLVDLAGSEWSKIGSNEKLQDTAANLPVLGSVLIGIYNREKYIPYRSSKLTCLLQLSLGGSSKTLLMVHLSPFEEYFQESLKSLRFASRIKEVKSMVKRVKVLPPPQASTSSCIQSQASTSSGYQS